MNQEKYREYVGVGKRQSWWTAGKVLGFVVVLCVLGVGINIVGSAAGWFNEGVAVVREEFGPREMLRKYEWFKDVASQLDRKRADISLFEARVLVFEELGPRTGWDRTDKEQYAQNIAELTGVRSSYNDLAAEYNAQMVKFNWSFAEAGKLPEGATDPLPREFKPYEEAR